MDGLTVGSKVTFKLAGIEATGTILGFAPHGQAVVHPDGSREADGSKEAFSVMMPRASLCLLPQEEAVGEGGDADPPSFTRPPKGWRRRRRGGDGDPSPYFVR